MFGGIASWTRLLLDSSRLTWDAKILHYQENVLGGLIAMAMNLAPVHRYLNIMHDAMPFGERCSIAEPVPSQAGCVPDCNCSVLAYHLRD